MDKDKIIKEILKNVNKNKVNLSKECIYNLSDSLKNAHRGNPILFAILSSSLASLGLATNSVTTIIGAMLLSPIGDLITKSTIYNLLNKYADLNYKYKAWYKTLFFVILFAVIIGYGCGKLFQHVKNPITNKKLDDEWPTNEMVSRAKPFDLLYMILIAGICGIALPFCLKSKNGIRVVGIGIATALIPPLANIGLSLSINIEKKPELKKYRHNAIYTGIAIVLVNILLLYIPSLFLLEVICKNTNIFKSFEKMFI